MHVKITPFGCKIDSAFRYILYLIHTHGCEVIDDAWVDEYMTINDKIILNLGYWVMLLSKKLFWRVLKESLSYQKHPENSNHIRKLHGCRKTVVNRL
jgi:hypothetical protein